MEDLEIEILPTGHVRFRRGDAVYNEEMKQVVLSLVGDDEEIISQLNDFFKGSEDIELLIGDTIFC